MRYNRKKAQKRDKGVIQKKYKYQSKVVLLLNIVIITAGLLFLGSPIVFARSYVFDTIDVDITVREDSVMEVEEKLTYEFDGTYRGVFRDITLTDPDNLELCREDPELQCGGFDFIIIKEVLDNKGNILPESAYTVEKITNDYGEERLKVTWIFSKNGRNFDREKFSFTIKYDVYGAIGYFDNYDLFYWNALFPDRDVDIRAATVDVTLPAQVEFSPDDLQVFSDVDKYYNYFYNEETETLELSIEDLSPFQDFTVLWRFPKGIVQEPAKLVLNKGFLPFDPTYRLNGLEREAINGEIRGVMPGEAELEISRFGYETEVLDLVLEPSEVREVDTSLSPTFWMGIVLMLAFLGNVLGCMAIPGGLVWLYFHWQRRGRDVGGRGTIMPIFEPPDEIPSYLLGALKDEKVDIVDITSTIIDAAYKGYIKIIEIKKKSLFGKSQYEFLKQKPFGGTTARAKKGLSEVEQEILNDIFDSKDRVTTEDLQNKFYRKISGIKNAIYDELVTSGYFASRPDKVRLKYIGIAILVIIIGSIFSMILSFVLISLTGILIGLFILNCAVLVFGIGVIVISFFMPAKTAKGTDMLEKVKGFRMFMYHAERYRMQNLTPEMFERFLSYAIVFGLEKQWAETFKDIYKGEPDWYEGGGHFSPWILANSLSDMSNTTASTMTSTPSSSSSGGGWSGGGGFSGGFSGGGGGGGGGGAF